MAGTVFPATIRAQYDPSGGFPAMAQDAQRTSERIKRQFESDFADVGRLAREALAIPRNLGGSLDLDPQKYRIAADNAKAYATALREVATAASRAAQESGDTTAETRRYVQAANAAALAAEKDARAVTAQAVTYERLQAELAKTKSATDRVVAITSLGTTANGQLVNSHRALRQATVQSGQQLQDIAISLQGGQRASTVFAQQLPQLAFALSGVGGAVGRVATILSGPWGLALVGASFLAGRYIDKLFGMDEATKKAAEATFDFGTKIDFTALSITRLTKAMSQLVEETEKAITVQETLLDRQSANASNAVSAIEQRLAGVRAEIAAVLKESGEGNRLLPGGPLVIGQLRGLRRNEQKLSQDLALAKQAQLNLEIAQSQRQVTEETDLLAKATREYKTAVEELNEARQRGTGIPLAGQAPGISQETYTREYRRLTEAFNARKKALQDLKSEARSAGDLMDFIMPVSGPITSGFGPRKRPTKGASANHPAIDIGAAFGTEIRAPQVGTVEAIGYDKGLGKYVVINHGAGTKTRFSHLSEIGVREGQRLEQGDTLGRVGSTGISTAAHLDYQVTRNGIPVNPRKGRFPVNAVASNEAAQKVAERRQREAEQLTRTVDALADEATRYSAQFDKAPRDIDRAAVATDRLQEIIVAAQEKLKNGGLGADQVKALEATIVSAKATISTLIPANLKKPFEDLQAGQERMVEMNRAILTGRQSEVDALDEIQNIMARLGVESRDQLATELVKRGITGDQVRNYFDGLEVLRSQTREIEIQREAQQRQLDIVNQTQQNIQTAVGDLLRGNVSKGIGNAFKRQFEIVIDGLAADITDSLFGGTFRKQREKILGIDKVSDAGVRLATEVDKTSSSLDRLVSAIDGAASNIASSSTSLLAANDNISEKSLDQFSKNLSKSGETFSGGLDDIIVTASASTKKLPRTLGGDIKNLLGKTFGPEFAGKLGQAFSVVSQGAAYGQLGSGIGKAVGLKQSKLGAQIGGAAGNALFGPLGGVVGGFIGGTIGGFLKKTPKGSTTISSFSGDLAYQGSGKLKDSVLGLGDSVRGSLTRVMEALNGTAGQFAVSIGQRGKKFVVDPTGQGRTKGAGVLKFKTEEEAARAALLDAINDGAVAGISQGAQNLLRAGKDLELQLSKAVKFQSVFDRLKAIKDPVGAALETLNREFTSLKTIFTEAGASAAEFAQLEELYGLERAEAIKQATEQMTGALQSLIDDLTVGDMGLSLRSRQANARALLDPLAADINAGKTVDYDKFTQTARTLLDITRQISGSTPEYFMVFDEILALSRKALGDQQNVISIASGGSSPFSTLPTPSNDNTPVVTAINDQTNQLASILQAINANIGSLGGFGSFGSFTAVGGGSFRLPDVNLF